LVEKPGKVRSMFAAIAGSYDLNNRLHSLWQDQRWRRFAVRAAGIHAGESTLDVACGTGELAQYFARTGAAQVIGLDFTPQMLEVARRKQLRLRGPHAAKLSYVQGDAMALPFEAGSFDVVSIAFGIRNVASPQGALSEFFRVLRPGGRLIVLEFDRPKNPAVRWLNDVYCGRIMPVTATLVSGDKSGAYKYLPASVSSFMSRADVCGSIRETGFGQVTTTGLSLGICVCYRAVKA